MDDPESVKAWDGKENALQTQRVKYPDRYPKHVIRDHIILGTLPELTKEATHAFTVYECDNPEQLDNIVAWWDTHLPRLNPGQMSLRRYFIPIVEYSKYFEAMSRVKE